MKTALAAAMLVLVLSGCAGQADDATPTPPVAEQPAAPAPETPAPAPAAEPVVYEFIPDERALLGHLRGGTALSGGELFSDAQVVAAAYEACELFAQGIDLEDMNIVDGDENALNAANLPTNHNDIAIAGRASQVLCLDYDITK